MQLCTMVVVLLGQTSGGSAQIFEPHATLSVFGLHERHHFAPWFLNPGAGRISHTHPPITHL
jgi:hypothetical protein